MIVDFASKLTKNKFCYHLVGFNSNVLYDTINRSIILSDADTGAVITIIEKDEDLDFDTFVLVSKNLWLDFIDSLS